MNLLCMVAFFTFKSFKVQSSSTYSKIIVKFTRAFGLPLEIKAEKEQNRKAMSKYFPQGNKNELCARALVSRAQALAIKTQSLSLAL